MAALSDLSTRARTGAILAVGAAVPVLIGGHAAVLFIAAVAGAMGWEFRRMTAAAAGPADHAGFGVGLAASTLLAGYGAPFWAIEALTFTAVIFATLDALRSRPVAWAFLGAAGPGLGAAVFAALRAMDGPVAGDGLLIVLWIALIVVATDTGAFFAGRGVGGPKLWPAVSPNKTWAGLVGGVLAAVAAGLVFSAATTGAVAAQVAVVAALAALVAQGGDLAESALKRRFGVKDSGGMFPGHGGMLDRVDGLVAVTLVAGAVTFVRGIPVFRW